MADNSTLALRNRLKTKLPAELYNIIYDLTFTADTKVHFFVCSHFCPHCGTGPKTQRGLAISERKHNQAKSCKHMTVNARLPHLLHVDRASRRQFAASFFGGPSSFVIYGACGAEKLKLLLSAESGFRDTIREVRVMMSDGWAIHSWDPDFDVKRWLQWRFGDSFESAVVLTNELEVSGTVLPRCVS